MGAQESTPTPPSRPPLQPPPFSTFSIPTAPCPPEIESSDEDSDIEDQLDLLKSGDQSDVTIICGGKKYTGHTDVMATRSDVFRAMFYGLKENRTLIIDNVKPSTLEIILCYIYSGKVPRISVETALKVYEAADTYAIESLLRACKRLVKKNIRERNALSVLLFASSHGADDLKDIAVSYISGRKNYLLSESWRRFCESNPMLAIDVLLAFVRKSA